MKPARTSQDDWLQSDQETQRDQDALVMVGRFLDPSEAQMAKGMLESAGVECFLQGANANAIVPLAFRVRLSVRRSDEDTARVLLAEAELTD